MTNKEFYKEDIVNIACKFGKIAVKKDTHELCECGTIFCGNCLFNDCDEPCSKAILEWSNAEYTEFCPFKKGEIVEVSDDNCNWMLRCFEYRQDGYYCCSNAYGGLYFYKCCRKYGTLGNSMLKEDTANE